MPFSSDIKREYRNARKVLIESASQPNTPAEVRGTIGYTLTACTARQAQITVEAIDTEFRAGVIIESTALNRKVPTYTGFDFSKVPQSHINKISKDTIGHIGSFNIELANNLKWQYAEILNDNSIVNSLNKHGFTKSIEGQLKKAGLNTKAIELIKAQTTTNKMLEVLEMRGIRGGFHPDSVAMELRPYIRQFFGKDGQVIIDRIGKTRRVLKVNAQGTYWWKDVVNTRKYVTNVQNYSDIVARTAMLKANNTGRVDTVKQSGLAEKAFRFVCACTGNSCDICIGMHGSIVNPSDVMPPVHPRCGCRLQAIWKKGTGLVNHTDEYYEQQQNIAIYRRHKLKEYNKGLPKGEQLTNDALLPRSEYLPLPVKEKMLSIKKAILG